MMGDLASDYDMGMELEDRIITCKYCGVGSLHWTESEGKYKLKDDEDKIHACKQSNSFNGQ